MNKLNIDESNSYLIGYYDWLVTFVSYVKKDEIRNSTYTLRTKNKALSVIK